MILSSDNTYLLVLIQEIQIFDFNYIQDILIHQRKLYSIVFKLLIKSTSPIAVHNLKIINLRPLLLILTQFLFDLY